MLRGPQGTLYGASSMGGTIKFISKQPDLKYFSGSTTETVSWTQKGGVNYEVQGILNVPLVKGQSALRIGVEHGHESGYIDQVDSARQQDRQGHQPRRLHRRQGGAEGRHRRRLERHAGAVRQQTDRHRATSTPPTAPLPRFQTSKTVREPGHDLLAVPSVTLTGDTSFGTFTGVLSGYNRRFNRIQDGTSINDPSYAVLTPGAARAPT